MQNEHYYKQELENKIDDFLEENADDVAWGYVGDNLAKLMADAAWAVLMASKDIQDFLIEQNELKP